MAEISKVGKPTVGTTEPSTNSRPSGLKAGEDLEAMDACYIKSDGTVWRASGAANNAAAKVRGFAAVDTKAGFGVTLLDDVNVGYGSGLTPGADLYLSGTVAGGLADAPSTGGLTPIAFCFDDTRIRLTCR